MVAIMVYHVQIKESCITVLQYKINELRRGVQQDDAQKV